VVGGIEWCRSIADKGDEVPALVEKGKSAFVGPEIRGKTLGVIGLGAIGAKLADDARHLGMKVYGYDPYLSVDAAWRISSRIFHASELDEIFEKSDYIPTHVPYLPSTKHIINKDAIAKMKDGVRILNLARGELVCDEDMIEALESGKVARYVTDFPNGKILGAKNVVAIPHLGASTPESEDNCAVMAARQVADYLENGNITNSVNIPAAVMPRSGGRRVCVIHKNEPGLIAQITSALSAAGANIENMLNSGRKGNPFSYTIIDVDDVSDEVSGKIDSIEGIVRTRLL
jgi:D-3-phosphoglycerate dehydrogenase